MRTIGISETRANLKAVVDKVVADKAPISTTRQKDESVVMISRSERESIEDTLYLLHSPKKRGPAARGNSWPGGRRRRRARAY
jgi:antitoxin YefM